MSKNRISKKTFAILTVLSMIVGIAVNVSAATHTTTTVYDVNDSTKVTVTSVIMGVAPSDQITYLAYNTKKGEQPYSQDGESNIVYIDQKGAGTEQGDSETVCTFTYTADIDKIGSTLVKFGSQTPTEITVKEGGTNQINSYNITVETVVEGQDPVTTTSAILPGPNTFKFGAIAGKKIGSIKIIPLSGEEINVPLHKVIIGAADTSCTFNSLNNGDTIQVKYVSADTDPRIFKANKFESETDNTMSTTFSKVLFDETATGYEYEYGILFYYDSAYNTTIDYDFTASFGVAVDGELDASAKSGIRKYKAFGKSADGIFGVQLRDNSTGYLSASYYTRTYLMIKDNENNITITYGDPISF